MTKKTKATHPESKGLFLIVFSFLLFLSLISFNISDISKCWLGVVGHYLACSLMYLFGASSYFVSAYLIYVGVKQIKLQKIPSFRSFYFSLLTLSICLVLTVFADTFPKALLSLTDKLYTQSYFSLTPTPHTSIRFPLGGVPLYYFYTDLPYFNLKNMISDIGTVLIFSLIGIVSFFLLTGVRFLLIFQKLSLAFKKGMQQTSNIFQMLIRKIGIIPKQTNKIIQKLFRKKIPLSEISFPTKREEKSKEKHQEKTVLKAPTLSIKENKIPPPQETKVKQSLSVETKESSYQLPSFNFLSDPKKVDYPSLKKDLQKQASVLEETLLSFGIEAKVGEINCGPTITSFEVHPPVGVKVQKIKALQNDIALTLQAKSIRIIAPIPGKACVGVEIPSLYPQEVSFKEMLYEYHNMKKKPQIPIFLGKSVSGGIVISDLSKMPHCLIAGATGSGKSVCINTIVMSILMTSSPEEVKLLMIDPKKVELTQYSELPHMIAPVITEAHGAYAALQWLVKEMQNRYELLKQLGLRNITAFNKRKINEELESSIGITIPEKMSMIVAIIDEFADLMMVSSSDLETPIARIAQMARAVGIHLILATQRPSREVITGIIKANFPCRIAFKVSSRINSQIILDEIGAENLLGCGDLLFLPPGTAQLIRAQGSYISDEDINKTLETICKNSPPNYLIPSFDAMHKLEDTVDEENKPRDALYDQALSIVLETKNASTTYLQRKLKIGYARAASLMDALEEHKVIGPQEGGKPRRILVCEDES